MPGTSALKTLYSWPALPIVLQYGGSPESHPPTPEDEEHIVAALKQSDRVSSISLTVTNSLLEKLFAIEGPFSELEDLVLLYGDDVPSTLSSPFRWGPRLRTLHLTRAIILTLPKLLFNSMDLVDLQLHEISEIGHISPETFASAISGMSLLRTLSLHFISSHRYPNYISVPLNPSDRVILPVLTSLKYGGSSGYLDSLSAEIDAPRLGNIDITFFSFSQHPPMVSHLGLFIDRIALQKSHRRADILFSEHAISISFTQPESPTRLELQVPCRLFSQQLSYITRTCQGLYPFLFGIEHLRICARPTVTGGHYQVHRDFSNDCEEWKKFLRLFRGAKWVHVACSHWTDIIVFTLRQSEMQGETLLPALHKLCIQEPDPAPYLQKAVGSLMLSRLLSGHIIAVEYERLSVHELHGTGTAFVPSQILSLTNVLQGLCRDQRVTIKTLSADITLNIFHYYLNASPKFWPTLMHVCRSWRQIILRYPLGLDLRLHCTNGMSVQKALECWPSFPLAVNYGGSPGLDPPALEDDDNIIALLKQSGRVSSISLTVTSSLNEKLPVITEPLSGLEELVLLSRDNVQLTLPSAFRWGSLLRTLHSTRVAIPSLTRLLSPCQNLTDLQLHEIPSAGYFSPEAFANALSGVTHLRTLSLHFLSFPSRRKYLALPPPSEERVVHPALTCFKYRGTSKYLDSFVARIDAPHLGDIDITFFSQPTMDASQLGRFIGRIELQTPLSRAEVQFTVRATSVTCFNQSIATPLRLQIPCEQLDWQVSSMAQICNQFSPFLFHVEDLHINSTHSLHVEDGIAGEQWLELIRAFRGAKDFHVAGVRVHVAEILSALRPADETVLPTLQNLRVNAHMRVDTPLWDAAESFLALRQLSGRPVELYALVSCHICYARVIQQQELKRHLVRIHLYRIYYGDFECKPEQLASRHSENAYANAHISNHVPPHSGGHGNGRPPLDVFGPLTRLQAPSGLPSDTSVERDVGRMRVTERLEVGPVTGLEVPSGLPSASDTSVERDVGRMRVTERLEVGPVTELEAPSGHPSDTSVKKG
jgi:hypothetical protein